MNPWIFVFFSIVMAFAAWFPGKLGERFAVGTGLVCLGFAVWVALGPDVTVSLPLLTGLKLTIDGFRRVYIIVICLMWAMTLMLSPEYFRHHDNVSRYYFFNLLTLGATLGVFLAADLYTAFVFFEIMSFTSFTWVIQEENSGAIRAANTYLAVTIGGMAAKKHPILMALLAYCGIGFVQMVISLTVLASDLVLTNGLTVGTMYAMPLVTILGGYFLMYFLTTRKLNLN